MELLSHIELATGADPAGTVIWMHGLGADGWDFVPLVRELGLPEELPLRFIFPHAPVRPVTINNGYAMRAWYDIAMADIGRLPDEAGIRQSQAQVEAFLARERSRGIAASRIVVAGFSQGGAIALHTGLRHAESLAGILALSTYLPLAETLARESSHANDRIPILMAHGTQDPVVPIALAESSRAMLTARGLSPEWHTYPMPHSVCAEEVAAISRWLVARYTSPILAA
ncbi:MAG TPA: alpha/beta hydrolase [Usitatibacteraceae bacterium]|nr:alpha/beta hydrolase [Usitatibacteraceae bacterium]